jgi:hypothetical protein
VPENDTFFERKKGIVQQLERVRSLDCQPEKNFRAALFLPIDLPGLIGIRRAIFPCRVIIEFLF